MPGSNVMLLPLLPVAFLTLALPLLATDRDSTALRPNVILLVADDLGYGELSCQGGSIPTPHIDSIATRGIRFTNGYVTAPFCAASRAALITGRYQTRFGFEFNPIGAQNLNPAVGLPPKEKTIADDLRQTGYATALVGKWHLGGTALYHPHRRGFDEFFGFLHEGHFFVPPPWEGTVTWLRRAALPDGGQGRWTHPNGQIIWSTHLGRNEPDYDADNPILRLSQPVHEQANLTDAFTREATSFIRRHQHQPFFLYLAYNAVHSPLQAKADYLQRFEHIDDIQRRIFAAMLAHLDDSIGTLLGQLESSALTDRTLLCLISDNGGPTAELTSSNAPLRGGKGDLWEGGIRVPFLLQWPGKLPAGQVIDQPVISLDLIATARATAGLAASHQDGIDLLPHLNPQAPPLPERPLYWRVGSKAALRKGPWKAVRNADKSSPPDWQLYHVATDLSETTNLANQEPDLLKQLTSDWDALDTQMIPPAW